MSLLVQVIWLGIIEGPEPNWLTVSSSAHVVVAEKLMGLDPSRAENDFAAGHAARRHHVESGHRFFLEPMARLR